MRASILAAMLGLASAPALAATPTDAQIIAEICPSCTSIVLTGNAAFQATGGRNFIEFSPQATGSALATFAGLNALTPYNIDIVGQNDAGSMFDFVLNTTTNLGVFNLGGFDKGLVDVTFSFTSSTGGAGSLLITSVDGNFQGKIDSIALSIDTVRCPDCVPTPTAVPGPTMGAGAVPILAGMFFAWYRRRRVA